MSAPGNIDNRRGVRDFYVARAAEPALPKIFVFCNSCAPGWHSMLALAEDGTALAGHICSAHDWAVHDMGLEPSGWKRDLYAAHYPAGFEVEWVDKPLEHEGCCRAIDLAKARKEAA